MKIILLNYTILKTSIMTALICFLIGCGSSSHKSNDSDNNNTEVSTEDIGEDVTANNFSGTWLIQKEDTISYWIFSENGNFEKKRADEPLNGTTHFVGTYTVSDGQLSGEFTNPGVGRGEIEGTIDANGIMQMDFIEYWHTPPKVVPCTGVRQ